MCVPGTEPSRGVGTTSVSSDATGVQGPVPSGTVGGRSTDREGRSRRAEGSDTPEPYENGRTRPRRETASVAPPRLYYEDGHGQVEGWAETLPDLVRFGLPKTQVRRFALRVPNSSQGSDDNRPGPLVTRRESDPSTQSSSPQEVSFRVTVKDPSTDGRKTRVRHSTTAGRDGANQVTRMGKKSTPTFPGFPGPEFRTGPRSFFVPSTRPGRETGCGRKYKSCTVTEFLGSHSYLPHRESVHRSRLRVESLRRNLTLIVPGRIGSTQPIRLSRPYVIHEFIVDKPRLGTRAQSFSWTE